MTTVNVRNNRQVIDYLARDYASFRKALGDLIPAKLPEWTDRSEADFGVVLIELLSYMGDILSYYQDRVANEAFLATAQQRSSVIQHLRLIGYEMAGATPSTTELSLIVANSRTGLLEVRKGDQFATRSGKAQKSVTFEYTDDKPLVIDLSALAPDSARTPEGAPLPGFKETRPCIPVREGRTVLRESIGVSSGAPNQRLRLAQTGVLRETIELSAATLPPAPPFRQRKNLIFGRRAFTPEQLDALEYEGRIASTLAFSRAPDADFATETDEDEVTIIVLGDGEYGSIPPSGIELVANYRVGGGALGNVGTGQITVISNAPALQLAGAKVVNRSPARGGADRESIEHAVRFAPTVFTSMNRAVTAEDYVAQARLFPGVSKARAEATNWNTVRLYIAPNGAGDEPTDVMKRDLLAYFEDKRMLTSQVDIQSPSYVRLEIVAKLECKAFFRRQEVAGEAANAVASLFAFDKVDFAQILYLSKIYEALEGIEGAANVFVERFRRVDRPELLAPDGRIALGQNEIPVLRTPDLRLEVSGGV
ncbi:MAG TPA: baseplate J/gp47 family protein [Polyangiaceae bacterium]|nr:baseplate J/gp47 family protein [Polyangiaceae bacterium]